METPSPFANCYILDDDRILMIVNFGAKTSMTYRSSRKMETWRGEVLKLGMARWIDANVGLKERIVVADMGDCSIFILGIRL